MLMLAVLLLLQVSEYDLLIPSKLQHQLGVLLNAKVESFPTGHMGLMLWKERYHTMLLEHFATADVIRVVAAADVARAELAAAALAPAGAAAAGSGAELAASVTATGDAIAGMGAGGGGGDVEGVVAEEGLASDASATAELAAADAPAGDLDQLPTDARGMAAAAAGGRGIAAAASSPVLVDKGVQVTPDTALVDKEVQVCLDGASSASSLSLCDLGEGQDGDVEGEGAAVQSHSLASMSSSSSVGGASASLESASSSSSGNSSSSSREVRTWSAGDASVCIVELEDFGLSGEKDVVTPVTPVVTHVVTREVPDVQPRDATPPPRPVQRAGGSPGVKGVSGKSTGQRHSVGHQRSPTKGAMRF